jgi:hypothetical protein
MIAVLIGVWDPLVLSRLVIFVFSLHQEGVYADSLRGSAERYIEPFLGADLYSSTGTKRQMVLVVCRSHAR